MENGATATQSISIKFEKGSESPANLPPKILGGGIEAREGFNVVLYNQRYQPGGEEIYNGPDETSIAEFTG